MLEPTIYPLLVICILSLLILFGFVNERFKMVHYVNTFKIGNNELTKLLDIETRFISVLPLTPLSFKHKHVFSY